MQHRNRTHIRCRYNICIPSTASYLDVVDTVLLLYQYSNAHTKWDMRKNNAPVRVRFNKEREVRARVHRGEWQWGKPPTWSEGESTIINQWTIKFSLSWSHDPYDLLTAIFCCIWHVRYGFSLYNVRLYQATILGLTVWLQDPYKPGHTTILYGTVRSPTHGLGWGSHLLSVDLYPSYLQIAPISVAFLNMMSLSASGVFKCCIMPSLL